MHVLKPFSLGRKGLADSPVCPGAFLLSLPFLLFILRGRGLMQNQGGGAVLSLPPADHGRLLSVSVSAALAHLLSCSPAVDAVQVLRVLRCARGLRWSRPETFAAWRMAGGSAVLPLVRVAVRPSVRSRCGGGFAWCRWRSRSTFVRADRCGGPSVPVPALDADSAGPAGRRIYPYCLCVQLIHTMQLYYIWYAMSDKTIISCVVSGVLYIFYTFSGRFKGKRKFLLLQALYFKGSRRLCIFII